MIRPLPTDDYETAIEEYPGYLALELDECDLSTDTPELLDFWRGIWSAYSETLVDEYLERDLIVHLPSGPSSVHITADTKLAPVLDQLPTFDVYFASGPVDAGPASGGGYVICLAHKASMADVKSTIAALAVAIRADDKAVRDQLSR
jgi:hypothetical protein